VIYLPHAVHASVAIPLVHCRPANSNIRSEDIGQSKGTNNNGLKISLKRYQHEGCQLGSELHMKGILWIKSLKEKSGDGEKNLQ
jgi:hypothetical protein